MYSLIYRYSFVLLPLTVVRIIQINRGFSNFLLNMAFISSSEMENIHILHFTGGGGGVRVLRLTNS